MSQDTLKAENITKRFSKGDKALSVLDGITFEVRPGEVLAILGKSGSGKTTLLNILSRIENPDGGSMSSIGDISYTPQTDLLLPWRTIQANTFLPFEIRHTLTREVKEHINELLKEMGLVEFKDAYPSEVSGGMKQKTSLVRSLAQDVPLYLFDEALSAIDFDSRLKIAQRIRSMIVSKKKIGVFVTHNIEEAISIADRIIVLSERPAKIIYESKVDIREGERDPVAIRKNVEFQKQFETIWKLMAQL